MTALGRKYEHPGPRARRSPARQLIPTLVLVLLGIAIWGAVLSHVFTLAVGGLR